MNPERSGLAPGLYLVSTPIGNARDITLRALDTLRDADVLAAEDTRSLKRLMEIHGIPLGERPCLAYHDHNGGKMRPRLLAMLAEGKSLAYASEAGTPMISDPGFDLARAARAEGIAVTAAPGAAAVITALTVAGLPTDRFLFAGFLPNAKGARRNALAALKQEKATLAFYESPKRLGAMLADAAMALGGSRPAAVCRELTKKFEEVREGTLDELAEVYAETPPKGEIVVLIGKGDSEKISDSVLEEDLKAVLGEMSVRDAADHVAQKHGIARRPVYQLALTLSKGAE
ncbi:16S rRNA (cytidine(1402)-2'-O)-methyltransferase [Salipiger sp. PrR002]|uniref:16S rRNA (cytidine(1402)-2'-O)-methyltransferase n=1 Tax=Salipiger sp. PrR002 TaxID=2706489 RepID=UPI0013BA59F8|nr:16S rRNA (cytidine(1402)-2'-O)-methyltransferase [Salipiger sp. PrR002]NDW01678.1 16S rRNA (cytidine(1402)-2'-O)-methyltransferase [Salipiger sp. PrR002]NDW59236.1 16S rRNA (cytidine(1402)-2'-O)-methyltransferase [Salipiger sp. PrR004]